MADPPPAVQPPAPVAPGAQNVNVLNPAVVVTHLWQEFHHSAAANVYTGPTADDRKVVENPDAAGALQTKQRLHLCFLEKAVSTIEASVGGNVYYAKWQIIDVNGNVIKEHPSFSQANYDANAAAARLQNAKYGWLWDGRNSAANPVFCAAGAYRSRITVKNGVGVQVQQTDAPIDLEGEPYRVFIVGHPKTDAELRTEFTRAALGGRLLSIGGERTARDCWTIVYRGQQNDGHIVFLGQGTEEATKSEDDPRFGAIATPHARDFKGWVRRNPHGAEANPDRVQIEDLGHADMSIVLQNPGGPAPNNPYSSPSNQPQKDGVQAHAGNVSWTSDGLSVGCTTVSTIGGATVAHPGSVRGGVRGINSSFGHWGVNAAEDVSVAGPPFLNKQTKRNRTADALIADDHAAPELNPPQHPAPAAGVPLSDEPLHVQEFMQRAAFGGFRGHEIPRAAAVADSPVNQIRIRLKLEDYNAGSIYHLYHHAVAFGHTWEPVANGFRITVWIPRKVIRGWNGNRRNLRVQGFCQIAWYIEQRLGPGLLGPSQIVHSFFPANTTGNRAALPNNYVGRARQTWNTPQPLASGQYVSVFDYRVELKPYVAGNDEWVAEAVATDLLSGFGVAGWAGQPAAIAAEQIVTVGNRQFIEGRSELIVTTVP